MKEHNKKTLKILAMAFGGLVVIISATTSFGFFYSFFTALFPPELLGVEVAAFISGVVGVTLLDLACVVWLKLYLDHAETSEQRAIAMIMIGITFLGAAVASVAHLGLTATSELAFNPDMQNSVRIVSLVMVILAVILNFGAMTAYNANSLASKEAIRKADERDAIQKTIDEEKEAYLTTLKGKVKERLARYADSDAEEMAARIASEARRQRREVAGNDTLRQPHPNEGEDVAVAPPPVRPVATTNGATRPQTGRSGN